MRQFVVTYENGQPSGTHIRDAVLFAESACNRSNLSGLANSVHTTELQDGSIVRVQVLNDVVRVHIELLPVQLHGDEESDEYNPIETEEYKIISFVSGVASGSTQKGGLFIDNTYPVQGKLKTGDLFNQIKLFKKIRLHSRQTVIVENEIASSDAFSIGYTFINNTVMQYPGWSVTAFKLLDDGTVVYGGNHVGYGTYYLCIGSKAKEKFSYSMIDEEYVTPPTARQVFPGKYTGNMRPLVQLLMGVGRMFEMGDFFDLWLRATKQPPLSSLTLSLVDNASKEVYFTCDTANVPSISNFKNNEMFKAIDIRFDYRWHKTHGIMWGRRNVTNALIRACDGIAWLAPFCADPQRDEEPFLVEIGYRGVYVAPLFRDIASFFDEVRDLYKRVYPEIETYRPFKLGTATLFEALGGFPLNDCFPIDQFILDRWCRSGYVVKADVDLSDFYADGNYYESISHGWAFADTANEAANITISRTPDVHLGKRIYSKCYKLTFDIQYNDFASRVNPNGLALLHVFKFRDYCDYIKALLLPDAVIDQIISTASSDLDAAQQIFDDYVIEPIFSVVVDKVVEEEGYLEEYASYGNNYYTPILRLWDDVLGNVKLFDYRLYYDEFLEKNPHLIPSVGPAPMYVTYINDSLRILMHDGDRLKLDEKKDRKSFVWVTDEFGLSVQPPGPATFSSMPQDGYYSYLAYVADDSPVPYTSKFYFTDREIRPTPSLLINEYGTQNIDLIDVVPGNWGDIGHIYRQIHTSYRYETIIGFDGWFVQAANDRSVLFAYLSTYRDYHLQGYGKVLSFEAAEYYSNLTLVTGPNALNEPWNGEPAYEGYFHSIYIDDSRIVVYGLPDLDGTVLSAKTIHITEDTPGTYKADVFSNYWFAFTFRRDGTSLGWFDWSNFLLRRTNTQLKYNTPPNWFIAYNYYGTPYFATNVDWESDQLYVKGSLTVAHVPVNAMFFGIVM